MCKLVWKNLDNYNKVQVSVIRIEISVSVQLSLALDVSVCAKFDLVAILKIIIM